MEGYRCINDELDVQETFTQVNLGVAESLLLSRLQWFTGHCRNMCGAVCKRVFVAYPEEADGEVLNYLCSLVARNIPRQNQLWRPRSG